MIARFLDPLVIEEVNATTWRLVREFRYDSAVLGARIIIPAGFVTDFLTIPRWPFVYWWLGDRGRKSAVVHDFLYGLHVGTTERRVADAVLEEALVCEGLSGWQRRLVAIGVRFGGSRYW